MNHVVAKRLAILALTFFALLGFEVWRRPREFPPGFSVIVSRAAACASRPVRSLRGIGFVVVERVRETSRGAAVAEWDEDNRLFRFTPDAVHDSTQLLHEAIHFVRHDRPSDGHPTNVLQSACLREVGDAWY